MKIKSRDELGKKKNDIDNLLEDLLPKYFTSYPNMVYDVEDRLEEKNIFIGVISGIFGSVIRTYELDEVEELGSFLKALYEVGLEYEANGITIKDLHQLNPELYYDENELSAINLYEREVAKNVNQIKLFVMKTDDKHYVCPYISLNNYIDKYFNNGLLNYNINTQRETSKKIKNNEAIESITIYEKNVNKIVDKLEADGFKPNTITLNIRDNGHADFDDSGMNIKEYGWLTINVSGKSYCDIIDGMHRTLAYKEYVSRHPEDTKKYTMLSIFFFDEKEAVRYIKQENEGTKINFSSLQRKDPDNTGVTIAKDLKTKCSKLKNKIADDLIDLIKNNKFADILTLGDGINTNFKLDNNKVVMFQTTNYLANFFDLVIDFYADYFKEKNLEPKQIYHRNNLFVAFSYIASKLQDQDNWENKLLELLSELDINKLLSIIPDKKVLKPQDIKKINIKMGYLIPEVESEVATTNE